MVNFVVKGPFEVPVQEMSNGARFIDREGLRSLHHDSDGAVARPGCYVFCWKASRGSLPVYVGKATRNILKEAFNPRNQNNLAQYINNRQRGRLQLYIVIQERIRFIPNKNAIAEVEEFLIGYAARRNPSLLNIHGTSGANWRIAGVDNHRRNGPDSSIVQFKEMLGIKKRQTTPATADADEIEPSTYEGEPANADQSLADDVPGNAQAVAF